MTAPGSVGRAASRALAIAAHERAVHLVDVEAVRKALLGCPGALTELEFGAVIALCDLGGFDHEITAAGLGISRESLGDRTRTRRRRVPALTRDLWAAAMLRPAADLIAAVRENDPEAVAEILLELDLQRLAALAVVLASMVAGADLTTSTTAYERAAA